MKRWLLGGAVVAGLALAAIPGANIYYRSSAGGGCARCHEIQPNYDVWRNSAHRNVNCIDCHPSSMTRNARRVWAHLRGQVPERVRLTTDDVFAMVDRCRSCHRQEFAQWKAGPHATTYARIFMDPTHNSKRRLMDDCLRCHGMHFAGGINDLVQPIATTGPWTMKDPKLAVRPAIPCLACHAMHRQGELLLKGDTRAGAKQELFRPSLALADRRSQMPLPLAYLPVPQMMEGDRQVKVSPDRRQALCYQCHAPLASRQVNSGDDRTPIGVHEGLGCLACHQKHGQWTRASCADCHPRLSNCGLDVEKMDTTFANPKSTHNVHFVKCADCHVKGVPPRKPR
ncbi:MAG: multiheme c-type cytochrome [Bryobacteraceae bacterium]